MSLWIGVVCMKVIYPVEGMALCEGNTGRDCFPLIWTDWLEIASL